MSEPFLAEVKIVGFNFAPRQWAFCDGQLLPINQNQALFSLLGTTYGGDGRTNFALPDLRGRTPLHFGSDGGSNHSLGQRSGEETHTVTVAEMPNHTHRVDGSTAAGTINTPSGQVMAQGAFNTYGAPAANVPMNAASVTAVGGGQGHDNMQPYLSLYFCIALQGIFPSRD
jgi:microcystin-dependent protein